MNFLYCCNISVRISFYVFVYHTRISNCSNNGQQHIVDF